MTVTPHVAGTEIEFPWLADPAFGCFGCSPRNPIGLKVRMRKRDNGDFTAETVFSEQYCSYPGIVHGGIVQTLVDEVMGDTLAVVHGVLTFTLTLRSRMLAPLMVGVPYLTTARILSQSNGVLRTEAEITGPDSSLHVVAAGTYQPIRSEQARKLMNLDDAAFAGIRHYFDHETGEQ